MTSQQQLLTIDKTIARDGTIGEISNYVRFQNHAIVAELYLHLVFIWILNENKEFKTLTSFLTKTLYELLLKI